MNYKRRVLRFNLIFLIALLVISFAYPKIKLLNAAGFRAPEIISELDRNASKAIAAKSKTSARKSKRKGNVILKQYLSDSGLINAAGNETALPNFYRKLALLQKTKATKVRIAWFGDSFIEGDHVTKDFREKMQRLFGGSGVGFMPVTSVTAGFRQTITQGFSKEWEDLNFKSDDKKDIPLFVSGHSFLSAGNNNVNFRAVKKQLLDSFTHMQVLYGRGKNNNSSLNLTINGTPQRCMPAGIFNVNDLIVNSKTVSISAENSDVPLFGFSFEEAGGITVDNLSFRGVSGTELGTFNDSMLQEITRKRPYDLIIIQYGPNLLYKGETTDFSWYARKMQPALKKLRADFPDADFLLVSTADKAFKYNGEWATQKGVMPLVDLQYEMAENAQMDFFNLFHAMGGEGQMINWVNAKPALANKDYTHVTDRGATIIADYLYTALINEFAAYKKTQE